MTVYPNPVLSHVTQESRGRANYMQPTWMFGVDSTHASKEFSMQCNARCNMHNQCAMYNVQCAQSGCNVQCTMCTISVQCATCNILMHEFSCTFCMQLTILLINHSLDKPVPKSDFMTIALYAFTLLVLCSGGSYLYDVNRMKIWWEWIIPHILLTGNLISRWNCRSIPGQQAEHQKCKLKGVAVISSLSC